MQVVYLLVSACRLVFGCRKLVEDYSLASNGVHPLSTVQIVGRLPGGGKKRKKKVFTTPKKPTHEKKKVKLPSLSMYSVGEDGSIVRNRRECPSPECGAGVFMANHANRQTCGKCGLTFMFETRESEEES